jgi:polyphosphate glucokinase
MELIGIDIGGTGIKGSPVSLEAGDITRDRFKLPTPKPSRPDAVADVVQRVLDRFPDCGGRIGITFPGVVRYGVVMTAANMDKGWVGLDADVFLTERLGRPVHLLNDADAAGVAEMRYGAGRGVSGVVVMITLGTGIGSALFNDGRLVPNTEFGHLEMNGKDAELQASGRAQERDKLSWRQYTKRLQQYLTMLHNAVWPSLVIIGGGVSKESEKFLPSISLPCPVVIAQLLNNAGIVGAAVVAHELG